MGEYFNGVKLGTCSHLMYVTHEELEKLCGTEKELNKSCGMPYLRDYLDARKGFLYRFPREYDQATFLKQIAQREPFDYIRLELPAEFQMYHRDRSQFEVMLANGRKECFNANFCLLDLKHIDMVHPARLDGHEEKPQELAKVVVEIVGNQYSEDHPNGYTVFRCPCCDAWVSCNSQEVEEFVKPAMVLMGYGWESQFVRPHK